MARKLSITPEAESDLRSIGEYIAENSPTPATRFVGAIRSRMKLLQSLPAEFGRAPEADLLGVDLRQLLHGMYRILYTVEETGVVIHAIRHGARRPLRRGELPWLPTGGQD